MLQPIQEEQIPTEVIMTIKMVDIIIIMAILSTNIRMVSVLMKVKKLMKIRPKATMEVF